jgi:hypothetical protein
MKKLLLSTISLLLFSISILIFDISCRKESMAQPDTAPKSLGLLIYTKQWSTNAGASFNQIWKCNYNGTGHVKIMDLPAGFRFDIGEVSVSPDGTKIFFLAYDDNHTSGYGPYWACSVNLDGTDFKKIAGNWQVFPFDAI